MSSLLVTGTIALDSVETPFGRHDNVLGGSATFFSYAASYFTSPRLVGIVGEDFPREHIELLAGRRIDTAGLTIKDGAQTFRWRGSYSGNMNEAQTLETHLNVIAQHNPAVPAKFADSKYVFLANTHPGLQLSLLRQIESPKLVVADTMNLWIDIARDDLRALMKHIHGMVLNDGEAKMLTGKSNLVSAAEDVLEMGPQFVVIKKGEHGCLMAGRGGEKFALPSFPTKTVVDPTGAGDSFAGGMMGYLSTREVFSMSELKTALAYGTVTASFTIEDFSLERLKKVERPAIEERLSVFRRMLAI
jgi:sugar/nucleoside kinase (ribokinase family)